MLHRRLDLGFLDVAISEYQKIVLNAFVQMIRTAQREPEAARG
jgi:hypothetical protein